MKPSMKPISLVTGLALFAFAAGCATTDPTQSGRGPAMPDPGTDEEYQVNFPEPGRGSARYIKLTIGEDLSKSCGLVQAHFKLDSAQLSVQDEATLRNVAECLERPELAEYQLDIIGRADSRGSAAYNAELGLERATSVKKLLIDAGVAADRIRTSSSGAREAVGDDKGLYSFGYDRRVDVVIAGVVRTPR